ncbi:MAG: hypothetical protein ACK4SY_07760 [Pyrobaculum sp.]
MDCRAAGDFLFLKKCGDRVLTEVKSPARFSKSTPWGGDTRHHSRHQRPLWTDGVKMLTTAGFRGTPQA